MDQWEVVLKYFETKDPKDEVILILEVKPSEIPKVEEELIKLKVNILDTLPGDQPAIVIEITKNQLEGLMAIKDISEVYVNE